MTTEIHTLAGAYVLDAVTDIERAAFDRHLMVCDTCAAEVAEMREAAARLADGAFSVPPPRLRGDVMAAIGRTRQVSPGPTGAARDASATSSRWRRFTAGAAAAGVLAVGVGAAAYAIQEQRVRDRETVAAVAQAKVDRTEAILSAPDVQVRSSTVRGGGRVTVAMSPTHRAGVVWLTAAAVPPSDRAFQLWLIRGGRFANAGVLTAGRSSAVHIVEGMPGNDRLGVTLEPAGGSPTPSSPVAEISLL